MAPVASGASMLRVLAGSGYVLFWHTGQMFAAMKHPRVEHMSGMYALSRVPDGASEKWKEQQEKDRSENEAQQNLRRRPLAGEQDRLLQPHDGDSGGGGGGGSRWAASEAVEDVCHCSYNSDPNALRDMVSHLHRYAVGRIGIEF